MKRNKGAIMWAVAITITNISNIILDSPEMNINISQWLGSAKIPISFIFILSMAILLPLSLCTMFWEIKAKYDEEDETGKELTWLQQHRGITIITATCLLLIIWPLIFILYPIGCIHLFFDIKRKYYY